MPDRQRHGRLSDDPGAGAEPDRPAEPNRPAVPDWLTELDGPAEPDRPAWQLAARQGGQEPDRHGYEPDRHGYEADQHGYEPDRQRHEPEWYGYEPDQQDYEPHPQEQEPHRQRHEPDWYGHEPDQQDYEPHPQEQEPHRPDPTAETMLLSRVTMPRPTVEPANPDSGQDAGRDIAPGAADFADSFTDADADADADFRDADLADADADPPRPTRSRSARASVDRKREPLVLTILREQRRRLAVGMAAVVAMGALLALPPVRAELRDSFTKKPQPYTALYFTSRPEVNGTVLTVPVSVHAVDTGTDAYSVHVWTVDAKGQIDDSHITDLKWDGQALSAVVSMPVNPAAEYVWVSLVGSDQTLHYKIAVA